MFISLSGISLVFFFSFVFYFLFFGISVSFLVLFDIFWFIVCPKKISFSGIQNVMHSICLLMLKSLAFKLGVFIASRMTVIDIFIRVSLNRYCEELLLFSS